MWNQFASLKDKAVSIGAKVKDVAKDMLVVEEEPQIEAKKPQQKQGQNTVPSPQLNDSPQKLTQKSKSQPQTNEVDLLNMEPEQTTPNNTIEQLNTRIKNLTQDLDMYIEMINRLETEKAELVRIVQQDNVSGLKAQIQSLEENHKLIEDQIVRLINESFLNVTLTHNEQVPEPPKGIKLLQLYLQAQQQQTQSIISDLQARINNLEQQQTFLSTSGDQSQLIDSSNHDEQLLQKELEVLKQKNEELTNQIRLLNLNQDSQNDEQERQRLQELIGTLKGQIEQINIQTSNEREALSKRIEVQTLEIESLRQIEQEYSKLKLSNSELLNDIETLRNNIYELEQKNLDQNQALEQQGQLLKVAQFNLQSEKEQFIEQDQRVKRLEQELQKVHEKTKQEYSIQIEEQAKLKEQLTHLSEQIQRANIELEQKSQEYEKKIDQLELKNKGQEESFKQIQISLMQQIMEEILEQEGLNELPSEISQVVSLCKQQKIQLKGLLIEMENKYQNLKTEFKNSLSRINQLDSEHQNKIKLLEDNKQQLIEEIEKQLKTKVEELSIQDDHINSLKKERENMLKQIQHLNQLLEERQQNLQVLEDQIKNNLSDAETFQILNQQLTEKDEKIQILQKEVEDKQNLVQEKMDLEQELKDNQYVIGAIEKKLQEKQLNAEQLEEQIDQLNHDLQNVTRQLKQSNENSNQDQNRISELLLANSSISIFQEENGQLKEQIQQKSIQIQELQTKISSMESELQQGLAEKLDQKEQLIQQLTVQLNDLGTQAEQLMKIHQDDRQSAQQLTEEIEGLKFELNKRNQAINELEKQLEIHKQEHKDIERKLQELEGINFKLQATLNQLQEENDSLKTESQVQTTQLKTDQHKLNQELEEYKTTIATLTQELQNVTKTRNELTEQYNALMDKISNNDELTSKVEQIRQECAAEIESLKKQLFDKQNLLEETKMQIQVLSDHNQKLDNQTNTLKQQIKAYEEDINILQQKLNEQESTSLADKLENNRLVASIQELNQKINQLEMDLNQIGLDAEKSMRESELELQSQRKEHQTQIQHMESKLIESTSSITQLMDENDSLTQKYKTLQEQTSNDTKVLAQLRQETENQKKLIDQLQLQSTELSGERQSLLKAVERFGEELYFHLTSMSSKLSEIQFSAQVPKYDDEFNQMLKDFQKKKNINNFFEGTTQKAQIFIQLLTDFIVGEFKNVDKNFKAQMKKSQESFQTQQDTYQKLQDSFAKVQEQRDQLIKKEQQFQIELANSQKKFQELVEKFNLNQQIVSQREQKIRDQEKLMIEFEKYKKDIQEDIKARQKEIDELRAQIKSKSQELNVQIQQNQNQLAEIQKYQDQQKKFQSKEQEFITQKKVLEERQYEVDQLTQGMQNLQYINEDLEMRLQHATDTYEKSLSKLNEQVISQSQELFELRKLKDNTQISEETLNELKTQLKKKDDTIYKLQLEKKELKLQLDESLYRKQEYSKDPNMIDRRVISKFLVNYFDTSTTFQTKLQILETMGCILSFSPDEMEKIGLHKYKLKQLEQTEKMNAPKVQTQNSYQSPQQLQQPLSAESTDRSLKDKLIGYLLDDD